MTSKHLWWFMLQLSGVSAAHAAQHFELHHACTASVAWGHHNHQASPAIRCLGSITSVENVGHVLLAWRQHYYLQYNGGWVGCSLSNPCFSLHGNLKLYQATLVIVSPAECSIDHFPKVKWLKIEKKNVQGCQNELSVLGCSPDISSY